MERVKSAAALAMLGVALVIAAVAVAGYNVMGDPTESVTIDTTSSALTTIDFAHHEIHVGEMFYAYVGASLASGESVLLQITPPSETELHVLVSADFNQITTIYVYEGSTTTGGTTVTSYNHNRSSSATSSASIKTGAAISSAGTTLDARSMGARNIASSSRSVNELILYGNRKYVFKALSGANSNLVYLRIDWYEE